MEPHLLSLHGQLDHQAIEEAIDAVAEGRCPGWRILHDDIAVEMVQTAGRGDSNWMGLGPAVQALSMGTGPRPERVWVILLREEATKREEILKFLLVGGEEASPI